MTRTFVVTLQKTIVVEIEATDFDDAAAIAVDACEIDDDNSYAWRHAETDCINTEPYEE